MNVFSAIGHFFARFGKKLGSVLLFARRFVSEAMLEAAIAKAVELGENALLNNETRRNQLVEFLQTKFHLGENLARWTAETAVMQIKNKIEEGAADVDQWLQEHDPASAAPPNPAATLLPGVGGLPGTFSGTGSVSGTGPESTPAMTESKPTK